MKVNFTSLIAFLMLFSFYSCTNEDQTEKDNSQNNDLTEITILTLPSKLEYSIGESLSIQGLKVEGTNEDKTKRIIEVTEKDITGFSSEKSNEKLVITITINDLTATFSVKILPIKVVDGVLTYVEPNVTELVLPNFVKSIGDHAFLQSNISSIQLNEGIVSIGTKAFGWSQIKDINFPKSLTTIDGLAFYGCNKLEVIDLSASSLTKISHECFAFNENVTTIKLPKNLQEIEYQAFTGHISLKELDLPESLMILGNEAFRECGLTHLRLPNNIRLMEQRVFYLSGSLEVVETFGDVIPSNTLIEQSIMNASTFERCPALTHFEIPTGIEIVGWNTISGSPKLVSLTIPSTVKQINFNAFGNAALQTVIVEGAIPAIAGTISGAWQAFPYDVQSIKVPSGSVDLYKAAEGWKSYASKIIAQ